MLFSFVQKSIVTSFFATIELFLSANIALAEKIIVNSKSPQSIEIEGSGNASVTAIEITDNELTPTGSCSGFVSQEADHTLVLTAFINMLQISVISPEDTTLIIKGPGGVWCNDDYNSKDPAIVGQWQAGTYSIWIGSYRRNTPYTYQLEIQN
jgi:hypothetical protein